MRQSKRATLWLAIICGSLTYLSTKPMPTAWVYNDWMQFAAVVVAIVAAKYSPSPIRGI